MLPIARILCNFARRIIMAHSGCSFMLKSVIFQPPFGKIYGQCSIINAYGQRDRKPLKAVIHSFCNI